MERNKVHIDDIPSLTIGDMIRVVFCRPETAEVEIVQVSEIPNNGYPLVVREGYKREVNLYLSKKEIQQAQITTDYKRPKKIGKIKYKQ